MRRNHRRIGKISRLKKTVATSIVLGADAPGGSPQTELWRDVRQTIDRRVDDLVADVLVARRKLAGSEITGIFGSILLHLLLFSAAVAAAHRHPQAMATPFIAIKFAPMPAAAALQSPKRVKAPSPAPPARSGTATRRRCSR